MTRLGDETVFKGNEEGSEEGSCSTAIESAEGKVGERDGEDTKEGGDETHSDIGYIFINSVDSQALQNKK